MRQLKRTAVSIAAAHVVVLWSSVALAQAVPAAPADSNATPAPTAAASKPDADAGQLTKVVVTGQRASIQSAQKRKQDSEVIVDSIVAEDIGKLPDRSVTEVLQRIVGVTMDHTQARGDPVHFSVEGSGVVIRGLTYVNSTLNGRETFSANGGRSLGFEDVPPELMAGVDVYKNPASEQTEGAIAGLVDLRTAMPFDFKGFKGSLSIKAAKDTLSGRSARPQASLMLSNTWETDLGKVGALLDLAHSETSTRTDSIVVDPYYPTTTTSSSGVTSLDGSGHWFPKSIGWRSQNFDRTRDGQYLALQWQKDTMKSSLTYFRSQFDMYWNENIFMSSYNPYANSDGSGGPSLSNAHFNSAGMMDKGTISMPNGIMMGGTTRYNSRNSQTGDLAWNFTWTPNDRWRLSSDLQVVNSRTHAVDSSVGTAVTVPGQTFDLTHGIPQVTIDAASQAIMNDPSKYYWYYTMEHFDRATGQQKAWKGDAQYKLDNPIFTEARFGVRLTERKADTENSNPNYNWAAVGNPWDNNTQAKLSQYGGVGNVQPLTLNGFMSGKSSAPSLVVPTMAVAANYATSYPILHQYGKGACVAAYGAAGCGWINWNAATFGTGDPSALNAQNERTQAVYGQLHFELEDLKNPIEGFVGARVIHTSSSANGNVVFTANPLPAQAVSDIGTLPTFTSSTAAFAANNSYTDVLPSLNLRMKTGNDLQFRFAASKGVSRPDFASLQAFASLNAGYQTYTGTDGKPHVSGLTLNGSASGNPDLRPVKSNNLDLTAEWYFNKTGSLTVAGFHKDLKDIVVNQVLQDTIDSSTGTPYQLTVTGPVNGAKGKVDGLEVAFQQYFDKLPGWLSGFGTQASFTYVNSSRTRYNSVNTGYCAAGNGASNLNLMANGCDTDGRSFGSMPLENLSKQTVNFALLYDQGPWSARFAYSWRSKYLMGVALNSDNTGPNQQDGLNTITGAHNLPIGLPLWGDHYGQLDFGMSYKVNDRLTVGLEGQNLTNSVSKILMQQHVSGLTGHAWYASGPSYALTARANF
jgi:TonB-dependent receptor